MRARFLAGIATMLALAWLSEAHGMGKVVLFSPVSGIVLSHGKPVAGAVLKRHVFWRWGNKAYDDETTTDAAGRFAFPERSATMLLGSVLPHEPFIEQKIAIDTGGKSYVAWNGEKRSYELNSELSYFDRTNIDNPTPGSGGVRYLADPAKPIRIVCSLETPARALSDRVSGICSFAAPP